MGHLSIIIVNYKSGELIRNLLSSASVVMPLDAFEWIVVDNSVGSGCRQCVLHSFPSVRWIEMANNAGFARACNRGMREAKGDCYLLLNPDILIRDDSVMRCYERLMSSSFVGCGIQLLGSDGKPQASGSHFMKGGVNHLLQLPYWGEALKRMSFLFGAKRPSILKASGVEEVDWVSGAFLMVKKEVTLRSGLMDEDFFLYGEEVEWCSRLRREGSLCLYGDLSVIHLCGEIIQRESGGSDPSYESYLDRKGFQLLVSNHLRIRKQYGFFWFFFQLLNCSWAVPFSAVAGILIGIYHGRGLLSSLRNTCKLAVNVARLWALLPYFISLRPHFYKVM